VVNGATNRPGPVAPGEIVVVYGSGLGPPQLTVFQADDSGFVSFALVGTRVFFNGLPAPVIYTSATQLSVVVPYGVAGVAQLNVSNSETQAFASALVPVTASAPGLFTAASVPAGIPPSGAVPVVVQIGGVSSPSGVTVAVE
jgi:uncharacterized protein (TIGR03437 family)